MGTIAGSTEAVGERPTFSAHLGDAPSKVPYRSTSDTSIYSDLSSWSAPSEPRNESEDLELEWALRDEEFQAMEDALDRATATLLELSIEARAVVERARAEARARDEDALAPTQLAPRETETA